MTSRRLSPEEARAERMRRLFAEAGEPLAPEDARQRGATYRALYQDHRAPVPGARRFLAVAHARARVVVVTNNLVEEQQEKLAFLRLTPFVHDLVTSEELGVSKPDPRFFAAALERSSLDRQEVVVLGDSFESDVVGARLSGLAVVWFNRFGARTPRTERRPPELATLRPALRAWAAVVAAHDRALT